MASEQLRSFAGDIEAEAEDREQEVARLRRESWEKRQVRVATKGIGELRRWAKPMGPPPIAAAALNGQ
eukprot:2035793-Alexandrium_andersonii.AAC.1